MTFPSYSNKEKLFHLSLLRKEGSKSKTHIYISALAAKKTSREALPIEKSVFKTVKINFLVDAESVQNVGRVSRPEKPNQGKNKSTLI